MSFVVIKRLIKSGFTSFFRNLGLSMAATLIMTITLLIISTIFILYTFTGIALDIAKNRVGGVSAYFKESISERDVSAVRNELEQNPLIKQIAYVSQGEALQKFRETAEAKGRYSVLESLKEFKPDEVVFPASLTIFADDLTDYKEIASTLKSERYALYFTEVNDNKLIIESLNNIIRAIQSLGIGLVILFVVITITVMFNTIRLAIYNRREEVEIMRLVGATNSYIRGPFFIEGMMYAFLATLITSLAVLLVFYGFSKQIDGFFDVGGLSSLLKRTLLWQIIFINIVLSLSLSIASSAIAIRRYLRI